MSRSPKPHEQHREYAKGGPVSCAVITVSDSRTAVSDTGGDLIHELLIADGHHVMGRTIVRDEPGDVQRLVTGEFSVRAQAVLLTGGTGISGRDGTFEAVSALLDKTLPGFGELFRMLSFEEIGSAAMLSRAVAGSHRGRFVAAMPGSPNAVGLAMRRLVIPELRHLVWELGRHSPVPPR